MTKEILDYLPHDDPDAIASRKDLLWLNHVFGNFRWICRMLHDAGISSVVELGAGDAQLACRAVKHHPDLIWTVIDLAPRPPGLPESIVWRQGDLFEQLPLVDGEALVANLFLHHLDSAQLCELGQQLHRFRTVISSEPTRHWVYHLGGYALRIFKLNKVIQHDLHVSIDAGFLGSELPKLLELDSGHWTWKLRQTVLGMYRLIAENHNSRVDENETLSVESTL